MTKKTFKFTGNKKKDYREVVRISEDLWAWLHDNPDKSKMDYPKYHFKSNSNCLFCAYHISYDVEGAESACQYCVLKHVCGVFCKTGIFQMWSNNNDRYSEYKSVQSFSELLAHKTSLVIWETIFDEWLR